MTDRQSHIQSHIHTHPQPWRPSPSGPNSLPAWEPPASTPPIDYSPDTTGIPGAPQTDHIAYLLDRSGSMSTMRDTAISARNEYVANMRRERPTATYTETHFDTICTVGETVTVDRVAALTHATYVPDGYTALYDAIGDTITALSRKVRRGDRVLFVIFTDGQNNSSRRWSHQQVRDLIARKKGEGNWTFTFLGAHPDTWAVAAGLGISDGNTYRFDPTPQGVKYAMSNVSASSGAMLRSKRLSTDTFFVSPTATASLQVAVTLPEDVPDDPTPDPPSSTGG